MDRPVDSKYAAHSGGSWYTCLDGDEKSERES